MNDEAGIRKHIEEANNKALERETKVLYNEYFA
jgi:hypothetical protein